VTFLLGAFFFPIQAFAYLVALGLLCAALYSSLTPDRPALGPLAQGLAGVRVVLLTGELTLRGGQAPPPVQVRLEPSEALVLKLYSDIEDLPRDAAAPLIVRVLDERSVVAETRWTVGDLEQDESFTLLLDATMLQSGVTYRAEMLAAPADPGSSPRALLRQSGSRSPVRTGAPAPVPTRKTAS
jgi:hypothetical protein